MPVINGVYLKDFTALPDAVADANIIPIAISGNQVAYRTTVGGIVTDARVTGKLLTGLSVTGGAIASTDSILTAFGKVQNQLNNLSSGYVTLDTAQTITGAKTLTSLLIGTRANFTSSGSGDTLGINHSSGSGIALYITKGGNGEGIYVNKSSGSGNAVTIVGTLNATTLVKNGGTSSQFLKADGSVDSTSYQPLLTNPVTGTGTTNYVPKFTGASTIGNSLIYDNGTAVGIGTTTPNYLFQVKKATNVNFGINLQNAGISLEATNDAITAYIPMTYYASAHYLLDGNVGINTIANAGFRLDVNGTARFASSISLTSASSSSSLTSTTNGIEISVDGSTTSNKNTIFKVGSSETMRIDASGRLGIGTTSPAYPLQVNGLISSNRTSNTDGGLVFGTPANGNYFYGADSGNYIATYTSNAERVRVTSAGNVGIGTTTPNNILHLYKASFPILTIQSSSYQSSLGIDTTSGLLVLNNESNSALAFNTNATERMRITSGGNVGIGTTSPTTKLEVIANANTFQMARFENTNNTSGNGVLVTNLGSNCNNTSSYHLIAATGGADKFYLYGNGTYTTVSDSRLKKDISKVTDNYLEKVLALNIVNYHWNDQNENDALEFGMIAQEVEELIPSIVHEGREDENGNKYKGIQASVLPYILIKAIQEQQAQIEKLKALINK